MNGSASDIYFLSVVFIVFLIEIPLVYRIPKIEAKRQPYREYKKLTNQYRIIFHSINFLFLVFMIVPLFIGLMFYRKFNLSVFSIGSLIFLFPVLLHIILGKIAASKDEKWLSGYAYYYERRTNSNHYFVHWHRFIILGLNILGLVATILATLIIFVPE